MQDDTADVYATAARGDAASTIQLRTPQGDTVIRLAVPGRHNIMNALAATAVTSALGVDLDDISRGLNAFTGVSGRLASCFTSNGARIINDTYNANPFSTKAAIDVLVESGVDTWLVLGDMAELGDEEELLHRQVGEQARELGVKHLLATGGLARFAVESFGPGGEFFQDRQQLIRQLQQSVTAQSVVLVKGSRSMGMEQIVNALVDEQDAQGVH